MENKFSFGKLLIWSLVAYFIFALFFRPIEIQPQKISENVVEKKTPLHSLVFAEKHENEFVVGIGKDQFGMNYYCSEAIEKAAGRYHTAKYNVYAYDIVKSSKPDKAYAVSKIKTTVYKDGSKKWSEDEVVDSYIIVPENTRFEKMNEK